MISDTHAQTHTHARAQTRKHTRTSTHASTRTSNTHALSSSGEELCRIRYFLEDGKSEEVSITRTFTHVHSKAHTNTHTLSHILSHSQILFTHSHTLSFPFFHTLSPILSSFNTLLYSYKKQRKFIRKILSSCLDYTRRKCFSFDLMASVSGCSWY